LNLSELADKDEEKRTWVLSIMSHEEAVLSKAKAK
jgi:hypothetical protein